MYRCAQSFVFKNPLSLVFVLLCFLTESLVFFHLQNDHNNKTFTVHLILHHFGVSSENVNLFFFCKNKTIILK